MQTKSITHAVKNLGGIISKNSPQILTGLGCAGLISTAILTGQAVPRALQIIEEREEQVYSLQDNHELPSGWEQFKLTWKCYIPAGIVGLTSIACIVGANAVNHRRNAALSALYTLSATTLKEYQGKVIEEFGRTKERKIRDDIAKDRIIKDPPDNKPVILTGDGEVLCYDDLSGRYFKSSIEIIRQKVNELNRDLLSETWLSLNDLYFALGLPETSLGDQMGFNIDKGLIDLDYSSQLTPNGQPALVINTKVYPKYN